MHQSAKIRAHDFAPALAFTGPDAKNRALAFGRAKAGNFAGMKGFIVCNRQRNRQHNRGNA